MCIHKLDQLSIFDTGYNTDQCSYYDLNNQLDCDSSDLSIIQLNIRGLNSKLGELEFIINHSFSTRHPDIILLCETWLTNRSPKPNINGYNIERCDRQHKKGGGVSILVSSRCRYKRHMDLESNNSPCFESCFIELETPE